jgi:RNA polymerase sigma-70 factor (ECF subfamily)
MGARLNRRSDPDTREEALQVGRAKAGDREAFSQLVRMHQAVVRAYVNAHVRGPEASDDLAQEVFLRAFRRLPAFQVPETGSIRPWLLGIARNLLLEHLRAEVKLQAQGSLGLQALLDARHLDGAQAPRDPMEIERRIEALQRCVGELAPSASSLIARHYFQRQTLASLAAEENRQESTLRMRLLRIREALRACIEHHTAEEGRS